MRCELRGAPRGRPCSFSAPERRREVADLLRELGPEPKLDDAQRERLCELLLLGPLAAGFSTGLWTCRRVAEVVRREFGVEYHPDHLGRILHDLGFSPQKPQRRASERNEAAIARWRSHDWPRIKKSPVAGARSWSFSMNPAFGCNH